jgi:hypothetical protein
MEVVVGGFPRNTPRETIKVAIEAIRGLFRRSGSSWVLVGAPYANSSVGTICMRHASRLGIELVLAEARELEQSGRLVAMDQALWCSRARSQSQKARAPSLRAAELALEKAFATRGHAIAITRDGRTGSVAGKLGQGPIRRLALWDRATSAIEHNYVGLLEHYQITEEEVRMAIASATRDKWEV